MVEANYGANMARQILSQAWDQLAREGETHGQLMPLIVEVNAKVRTPVTSPNGSGRGWSPKGWR
ncbi:hypothetical protein [Kitasatospora sp. NPDC091276]|uniref:hypothetical protein n=1 Tax=unclassified Kitasatospora TaxID=2633591 RepID=UPI0034335FC6